MGALQSVPETAMRGQIILSHGSDSGPGATKISALAARAEALGWRTERPDFRADDAAGHAAAVAPRVARLRAAIAACDKVIDEENNTAAPVAASPLNTRRENDAMLVPVCRPI